MKKHVDAEKLEDLLYQALETEIGGVDVYNAAIALAIHPGLHAEWRKYLEETKAHVEVVRALLVELNLDPDADVAARLVVRHHADSLLAAMDLAAGTSDTATAQLAAAECVVLAETKDHLNWQLIGLLVPRVEEPTAAALKRAHGQVAQDEHHHLYHNTGWVRELWLEALGQPAVLPPPEEQLKVETAIDAARAGKAREQMA